MLFATYQSLERAQEIEKGKFKPYTIWAVAAEDLTDLFLSLFCCAPNRMETLVFFETDDYVRVDKVKWYQTLKGIKPGEQRDPSGCVSDEVDNLHSEFMIGSVAPQNLRMMVAIVAVGESPDIFKCRGLTFEGHFAEYMANKAKSICAEVHYPAEDNIKCGMSESLAVYRSELQPKKVAFELVYLPLAFKMLTATSEQFHVNIALASQMFSRRAWDYYRLNNDFTLWSIEDCSLEQYDAILARMRANILDNAAVAEALAEGKSIGRNDPCPCGSGKKFKKCHGMWA